jgi:3-oxoacyl-[acyl-carrier-protein] synthase III
MDSKEMGTRPNMEKLRAKITAVGAYVPPRVVTNDDLSGRVDTNHEWIYSRTGIKERRLGEPGTPMSELAINAVNDLLKKRGIGAEEIDLIIVGTITPDMVFPATACVIQDKIGAKRAWGFDLSAACSAFVYGLTVGAGFIENGSHRKVVVVGGDMMSSILDFEDRSTCVLFGDGAGAVLIEPAEPGEDLGLIDFMHEVDGSGGQYLNMPAGGSLKPASHETVDARMHYVHQDGQAVYKFAVRKMEESSRLILERNELNGSDLDLFIPHQANIRIINAASERLGLREDQVMANIDRYGNTTGGTIPLAMYDALEEGRLKKGDLVLLTSVGAGFTVGTVLLRWAY